MEQRRVAASMDALRRELETEGFHVFSLSAARSRFRVPFLSRSEKIKGQDFLLFNTQLKTLLRAGMPLAQSLELLKDQQADPHFRSLLAKIHQQVTTGVALSDAFLSLGETFPRLYANSLKAGERTGELEQVIDRYVEYQRLVETVRKKIIGALTYPAVLVTLSVGLVFVLMIKVIPSFQDFYVQFETELPLPTQLVLAAAAFIKGNFLLIILGLIVSIYLLRVWRTSPSGRMITDRWRLKLPLIGRLSHLFAMTQFTRSLAILLGGGTPMVPALETSATSVSNAYISELLLGCVQEVQEGRPLSDALADTNQAPDMALAMIRVGESTGALPELLENTSTFFDEAIEFSLNRMVTLFEPAILIVMGLVVAGLLLAVYYPLLTIVSRIA
ncbi:MAG: type II secretion system F family protein [Holophagae bacterium]